MPIRVADDDRAEFLSIAGAKEIRIQRDGLCHVSDVVAIDRTVPCEFRQRQVVRIEREKPQAIITKQ